MSFDEFQTFRYSSKYNSTSNEDDATRAKKYYANVEPEILEGLYEKYYWDFKIFGYSPAYVGHPEISDGI